MNARYKMREALKKRHGGRNEIDERNEDGERGRPRCQNAEQKKDNTRGSKKKKKRIAAL
jgi:hypothetical protein